MILQKEMQWISTCGATQRHVTEQIAGTIIVTKNGPNAESKNSLGCWAMYANNCYISHSYDNEIVVTSKCIRVDQISLLDMLHIAKSLQSVFYYKATHCYTNMVASTVDGQPDELEKLTIFGILIAADAPDLVVLHEQLTDFPYKLVPEAMQNIRKILQSASKDVQLLWSRPNIVNKAHRDLTE